MTRDEALKLLRGGSAGIAIWNGRRKQGETIPDLSNPIRARPDRPELYASYPPVVDLKGAELIGANLNHARLANVDFSGANLAQADLRSATLSRSLLHNAYLAQCRLSDSELRDVRASGAKFFEADLSAGDLEGARLEGTDCTAANLTRAKLQRARLPNAKLVGTTITDANFAGAVFAGTILACDLSTARNLDLTKHWGRSYVDVNSILSFKDELPEVFLRGCGLRDEEIAYFRSVVGKPIRFYSCFISYSTNDEEFASRLHSDFQAAGIRCWKWDRDARTGRSMWGEIDQAIRVHDKVVLIASESSLKSPGVNREIERALQEEDRRIEDKHAGKFDGDIDVLFPVRVDGYVFDTWQHERKADVVKRVIADASNWSTDATAYAKVRDKLIKDLKPT